MASLLASHNSFWRWGIRVCSYHCHIIITYPLVVGRFIFSFLECLCGPSVSHLHGACLCGASAGCPGERRGDPHGGDATEENGCSHVRAPSSCGKNKTNSTLNACQWKDKKRESNYSINTKHSNISKNQEMKKAKT